MNDSMLKQLTNNKIVATKADRIVKDLVKDIANGINIQNINDTNRDSFLDSVGAIILKPAYQRDYRYSKIEESALIESMLLGIPIPPVYMVSTRINGISALDVVDGQHRLTAIYRFMKNKFKLSGLSILTEYNDKYFDDLLNDQKVQLAEFELSIYKFTDYPSKEVEIEIFRRYNQGTKPLTAQEIRMAVYRSPISDIVNKFINKLHKPKTKDDESLHSAYNATKDRLIKKKVHESIFAILYIIENGFNDKFRESTSYSEEYMKQKANQLSNKEILSTDDIRSIEKTNELFDNFNNWILYLTKKKKYPFSKELYGISSRNYKFQMSIAMLLAGIFNKYKNNTDILNSDDFFSYMTEQLRNSYLEDPNYNASSTNSNALITFLNEFNYSK